MIARSPQQTVNGTKVLVCTLGADLQDLLDADGNVYTRHYRRVERASFSTVRELVSAVESGYDAVHMLSPLTRGGLFSDSTNATLLGTNLVNTCCERSVKLLWIANENKAGDYIEGFKAGGKPVNLIMTISRRGACFTRFLAELLSRTSAGETLSAAWATLAPQFSGPWHQQLPNCIFYAGRAGVRLLP